ncbi:hypothetical protein BJY04DRAFT_216936 [Aspergillus karnatakaensis]|uniref:uncharacterized protein n=1 Tax=Aspergillus karnatakaensis TaxID=1810916 RepID=UPI003CCE3090
MAWYSLLPAHLVAFESWIVRCFIFLGLVMIVPWMALIVFDIALYLWRLATYNIPVVGGRARGRQRPRAPSLNEIPDRLGLSAEVEGKENDAMVMGMAGVGRGGEGGLNLKRRAGARAAGGAGA